MISGERKHFELRTIQRLRKALHPVLNNTCLVIAEEEMGYCYISFSESFIAHVGKVMPRGIAEFDPAYIEVRHTALGWEVSSVYYRDSHRRLLWRTGERPSWIGKLKKGKVNGHDKSSRSENTDTGSRGAPSNNAGTDRPPCTATPSGRAEGQGG